MRKIFRRGRPLFLTLASVVLSTGTARAEGAGGSAPVTDDSGFAVLSNATNVTHWGLGVGVGIQQAPYKGYGSKYTPIPLFYFEDKWIHAFGTTIDLKIGQWNSVVFSLRGKYEIGDGYKGSDAPILNGMETRAGAFWVGPALAWHTAFGTLSGDFLSGGNKGQKANLDFGKSFDYGSLSIEPHIGAQWFSNKYVDYYYGVRESEVRAGRPAYSGESTIDESVGAKFDYRVTPHQLVTVDLGVTHLGSGITDSPLIGKRFTPTARIGYLYQFN